MTPSGNGAWPRRASSASAAATTGRMTRSRALSLSRRETLEVGKTRSSGRAVGAACRWLASSSRSAGRTSTSRMPASVLESPTEIRPLARSMSRQRRAVASPIRRPAWMSAANQRAPAGGPGLRLRIELRSCVDHRDDLLGRVEEHGAAPRRLEFAVPRVDAHGVARDQVAFLGDGEDLTQARDRLVDRLCAEHVLAHLEIAVGDARRCRAVSRTRARELRSGALTVAGR